MAGVERERSAADENALQIEIDRVLLGELEYFRGNRVAHRGAGIVAPELIAALRTRWDEALPGRMPRMSPHPNE